MVRNAPLPFLRKVCLKIVGDCPGFVRDVRDLVDPGQNQDAPLLTFCCSEPAEYSVSCQN